MLGASVKIKFHCDAASSTEFAMEERTIVEKHQIRSNNYFDHYLSISVLDAVIIIVQSAQSNIK